MSQDYLTPSTLPHPPLKRTNTGFTPNQIIALDAEIPASAKETWFKYSQLDILDSNYRGPRHKSDSVHTIVDDADKFEKEFVNHVETSLGRSMYNCDDLAAYQAAANTVRDALVIDWSNTQQRQTIQDGKKSILLVIGVFDGKGYGQCIDQLEV